jgi:MYXO-CTERM domain-containing protein
MSKILAASAGLALAAGALAGNSYNGGGVAFADLTTVTSDIVVADSFSIADVSVTLNNITHTWVGDLTISLSNGSTSIDLIARPGFTGTGFGSSGDLNGNYSFATGGAAFPTTLTGTAVVPSGTYAPIGDLSLFNGQNSAGTWTLSVADAAGGDTGALGSWTLNLTPVPTPGAAALLGLAGVAGLRRRR